MKLPRSKESQEMKSQLREIAAFPADGLKTVKENTLKDGGSMPYDLAQGAHLD